MNLTWMRSKHNDTSWEDGFFLVFDSYLTLKVSLSICRFLMKVLSYYSYVSAMRLLISYSMRLKSSESSLISSCWVEKKLNQPFLFFYFNLDYCFSFLMSSITVYLLHFMRSFLSTPLKMVLISSISFKGFLSFPIDDSMRKFFG